MMRAEFAIFAIIILTLTACHSTPERTTFTTIGFEQRTLGGNYTYGAYNITDDYTESGFFFDVQQHSDVGPYSFSGIGVSSKFDVNTFGEVNAMSCYAGSGCYDSRNFAIAHYFGEDRIVPTIKRSSGLNFLPTYAYFCISTYSYLVLRDGYKTHEIRAFEPGDSMYVTINGYDANNEEVSQLNITVARYTENDTTIMKKWTKIDLTPLGEVNYLQLRIFSTVTDFRVGLSDIPPYICIDDFTVRDL